MANTLRETCSSFDRMRGLIGRPLREGEALLIPSCRQVHTFGMRDPIDVIFCDGDFRVVHVVREMSPRRVSPVRWDARSVIELRSGAAREVAPGETLHVCEDAAP